MKVRLEKGAKLPTRAFESDAGLDIYSNEDGYIDAGSAKTFSTGLHIELPSGTAGIMLPKSGLMVNKDILTFGVIDESYRGEVKVHVFNFGKSGYFINAGDKISQILIIPVMCEDVEEAECLSDGKRGNAGFGSSGR